MVQLLYALHYVLDSSTHIDTMVPYMMVSSGPTF